jgi:hypothetical protein
VAYYLNVERGYGKQIVRVAADHNTREFVSDASHIDPTRTPDNFILRGPSSAQAIARQARTLMKAAEVGTLRKDAVTMLEVLFSLPACSVIDARAYFAACVAWAEQHFAVPVLSAIVHLDEGAPHCHLLLLPLRDGRMVGSSLYGNRAKLTARQVEFYKAVAEPHGLPNKATPRLSAGQRADMLAMLAAHAAAHPLTADQFRFLMNAKGDLAAVFDKLGLPMPAARPKPSAFIEIMTKPQSRTVSSRQSRTVSTREPNPELGQSRSCDGFAFPA